MIIKKIKELYMKIAGKEVKNEVQNAHLMARPELFKHRDVFIRSMEELIKRYEGALKMGVSKHEYEDKTGGSCLLCNPLDHHQSYRWWQNKIKENTGRFPTHKVICERMGCPWLVITGMTCDEWSYKNISTGASVYNYYDPKAMRARIEQLKEWIEIYSKKEL